MKTVILSEAIDLTEASVDAENRVIRNVVLIKEGMSGNRRFYTDKAVRDAVPVFEKANAYADHPTPEQRKAGVPRSIRDTTGWYENVRYENGKLIGDRHFSRNSAGEDVWRIAEDIASKRAPASLAGLSINAVGNGTMKKYPDGEALEVTMISKGNSVDDVSQPAAGGAFVLTASMGDDLGKAYLDALTFEEWFESRPEFVKRVQGELKTVRQDDAVKAAKAEANQLTEALTEAETLIQTLTGERDAALVEAQSKARELAMVKILGKVTLPKSYKDSLYEDLLKLPETEWQSKIDKELAKAKSANVLPRVQTSGGGQLIHTIESVRQPAPRPVNWAEIDTPEKQLAILESRKQ